MRLKLKTAPTVEPVTLDEAKLHLKVDSADDNPLITALIATARELAERETKRAFVTQIWELILDTAGGEIEVPKPPLQSVESITVIDKEGGETVVDASKYDVDKAQNSYGRVRLRSGSSWPAHRGFASFIVEFKAGYGNAAADVPEALKQAILQLIAHLYENRESVEVPAGVKILLWAFKIMRI